MKNVLIVGAGTGGTVTANKLAGKLHKEVKDGQAAITVLDGGAYHEFQPDYLSVAFRGLGQNSIRRPIRSLLNPRIKFVNEYCSKIDLDNRYVITQQGKKISFDYVVIAIGCVPDPHQIPGLAESNQSFHVSAERSAAIYEQLSRFSGGKIVTGIAGLPYKCPPSPNESAFLLDEFFTKKGIRDRVDITFITPYLRVYPAEAISEVIEPIYRQRKIETKVGFNVDSIDTTKKEIISMEGESIRYDELFLVPPHKTPDVLGNSNFTDSDGWIIADKLDLHIKDYYYAYAIGDNTNLPISKAGVDAHLQGIVVANNISDQIRGESDRRYHFTGRLQCSMETGYGQATFVIGTYKKPVRKIYPSYANYMRKKLMSKIYWASEKGRFEWLFKLNFGEDYYEVVRKMPTQLVSA